VEGDFASVNSPAALCVYRIAQEALRNVIAHAAANHVEVELRHKDDHVELAVTDDGQGFESLGAADTGDGLGLVSISERAKIAGGTVTIVTAPARGTRVQAIIPAKASARTDRDHGTEGQVA
jgi:two-component system sensor histidine kinase UhpB